MISFILALIAASGAPLATSATAVEATSYSHVESIESIYLDRGNRPIWVAPDGGLNPSGSALLTILRRADQDGLRTSDYHEAALSRLLDNSHPRTPFLRAATERIEFLLTDAFLSFGLDLGCGRIDPDLVYSRWDESRNKSNTLKDLVDMLVTAPVSGESPGFDTASALDGLRPNHFDYRGLKVALAYYSLVARSGGWSAIPGGEILRAGDRNHRVSLLRTRLSGISEPDLFDDGLVAAVRSFQARHGLRCDGLVGEKTLAALNEPAAHKAERIALNLERIRWLPAERENPFIKVNLPSCRLDFMAKGKSVLSMKTVVGRQDHPTPVMFDEISWMELNPYWNVPQKLVRRDILPKVLNDPQYLQDRGFHVFETWQRGAVEMDVEEIDWNSIQSWDIAFRFRQDPGPRNPLGRLKFLFPNRFSIYLHDTNQRESFSRDSRCLSSGCVRLEDAWGLANLMAPAEDFSASLESQQNRTIRLARKVPVFIVYQTVWIDNSGRVNFAPDIYGYDARMRNIREGEDKEILVAQ